MPTLRTDAAHEVRENIAKLAVGPWWVNVAAALCFTPHEPSAHTRCRCYRSPGHSGEHRCGTCAEEWL